MISNRVILIFAAIIIIIGYILYSQSRIENLLRDKSILTQRVNDSLHTITTLNASIDSYQEALKVKESTMKKAETSVSQLKSEIKGLSNESSKKFLNTVTPDNVRRLLEQSDYYKGNSAASSSSVVSGDESTPSL